MEATETAGPLGLGSTEGLGQRNPEALTAWRKDCAELRAGQRGDRLFVSGALVNDTFPSRSEAEAWFAAEGCNLHGMWSLGLMAVIRA